MAKKPEFKLYRICNRESGKAFQCAPGSEPVWTDQGCFFRSPETIRRWVRFIIHEQHWKRRDAGWMHIERGAEIPGMLDKLYIECYSVLQLAKHTEEAAVYLGKPAPDAAIPKR